MSGYRYLTLADRQTLEALYLEGDRVQDIADQIGVHVATVYKELKRGETGGLHLQTCGESIAPHWPSAALRRTSKGAGKGKPTKPITRILPKP